MGSRDVRIIQFILSVIIVVSYASVHSFYNNIDVLVLFYILDTVLITSGLYIIIKWCNFWSKEEKGWGIFYFLVAMTISFFPMFYDFVYMWESETLLCLRGVYFYQIPSGMRMAWFLTSCVNPLLVWNFSFYIFFYKKN